MKKLFIILSIFLNFCLSANSAEIKFIQVTDVHLTKENAVTLENFVNEINNSNDNIDFIVFTGDNIDRADRQDFDIFLNIIKNLKVKPYVIAGNHDLFKSEDMTIDYYMNQAHKVLGKYHPPKPDYCFKKGNTIFIAMNGVKEFFPAPNGYFKEQELLWLDKKLTKYKNNKVVILQHFPLLETKTKSANLYRKEDYMKVLEKHNNVIAIVSGHYHQNREEKINNVYHIVTPKFAGNTCYKVITIDEDNNFVYTSLIDKNAVLND